ncbi:MAG: nucleotidyltransferase family protein [Clostridiales bacterium]|nr:nucleotidyltransferase family protein [Clostridiales bacterium]
MTIVAGIVCEYNPFHHGHMLQINKLRQEKGAEAIVCAMSGWFMQRGEPAVVVKERRSRMALACGADLVIELPALYATRSAHWFALGGVSLLAAAGVTHLAFGAESDALRDMQATAQRLAFPDTAYQDGLRRFLSAGLPYAEAQTKALNYGEHQSFVPTLPNDRLALAYLRVIAEMKLPLEPLLIPREGSAYWETALPDEISLPASASAIRRKLEQTALLSDVAAYIPQAALPYLADTPLLFSRDAAPLQLALLRRASLDSLRALPDMTEGLEYRVQDAAGRAENLNQFYALVKTRRYTFTRLQRMTAHLLIDYRESHAAYLREGAPYLRVLGANETGRQLLHRINKTPILPLITRTSQMKALTRHNPHAANAWEVERRAAAMYSLLSGSDYTRGNPEYFLSSIMV